MMKKTFSSRTLLLFCFLFICSCDANKTTTPSLEKKNSILSENTNGYNINAKQAEQVAARFANVYQFSLKKLATSVQKINEEKKMREVENVLTLNDKKNTPLLYLINYRNKGFVIISGDQRSKIKSYFSVFSV